MSKDRTLARTASKKHALVPVTDTAAAGLTTAEVEYRRRLGRLDRVRRGVWRMPGIPPTWEQFALAACLAAGPSAVLSHGTAGWIYRCAHFTWPDLLDITVPWPLNPRLTGVKAHRVSTLDPRDMTVVSGLPVTTVARTVIDIASLVPPERVGPIVNDLMRRRLLTVAQLRAAADRVDDSRLRRRMKLIRTVIAQREEGFHPGDSDPEIWMVEMLVRGGLPKPVQQHEVRIGGRRYRLDAAYPEFMVAMEYEGLDGHGQPLDVWRDRARLNDITGAGWDIRFATAVTTEREFVEDVRAALRRAGAQV